MPEFWVNMGPQHPMTHGLWNMRVKIDGETIVDAQPEIGYLHRGYEKIMEVRSFNNNVVLTDRLCYVSSVTWSHAYCLAVEKMMGIEAPPRGQWIRVLSLELQRVASHLMWLAAYGPDLGLLTSLLWGLRERELFLDLLQLLTGQRMNQNFPRVGGVRNDVPPDFEKYCRKIITHFEKKLKEYERLFHQSKIFRMRTQGVGNIRAAEAIDRGVTGPNLRACGVDVDLRRDDPYEAYEEVDFVPQVWTEGNGVGDSYSRFAVRFNELRESCKLMLQALDKMPDGPYRIKAPRRAEGEGFVRTEDARGEALFYVIGDGDDRPYRVKIRSPVFSTIHAVPIMLRGEKMADVVAIIGSVDVCVGEMDK